MAKVNPVQESEEQFVDELKPGSKLLHGQYTIERFLNAGGFGITYLARNSLDRVVVIKECFPGNFCRRTQNIVTARSRAHEAQFAHIVRLFVQEAKSLSRLVHPNIVGVHQVFEENDTAYMAIDYVDGRDLLAIIETDRASLTPAFVVTILRKLLGAVAFIHDNGMLHRDISPDNILISRSGEPILIDFGAARQQATKVGGKALSALRVVKDGYSPQEFYVAGSNQTGSSDLYALAATFHHVISGEVPPSSQSRLVAIAEGSPDPYKPLAGRFSGYPPGFLAAIDKAMNILPKDRLPSAHAWLELLAPRPELRVVHAASERPAAAPQPAPPEPPAAEAPAAVPASAPPVAAAGGRSRGLRLIALAAVVLAGTALAFLGAGAPRDAAAPAPEAGSRALPQAVGPAPARLTGGPAMPAPAAPAQAATPAAPAALPLPARAEVRSEAAAGSGAAGGVAGLVAPAPRSPSPPAGPAAGLEPAPVAPAAAGTPETPPATVPAAAPDAVTGAAAGTAGVAPSGADAPRAAAADPAVLPDQVAAAAWNVALPFRAETTSVGGRFPAIVEVLPGAAGHPANGWIAEGVTILAVEGAWVGDEAALRAEVEARAANDGASHTLATARIRRTPTADLEEVTLAVPMARDVTLLNGVRTRATAPDGTWRTEVVAVPASMGEGALAAGDVLVAETGSGAAIDGSAGFETAISMLAAAGMPLATFRVLRAGREVTAVMPLVRSN
ncbi:MAG: serine/threonine protein kinase [Rhodobacteraceae bacterium]|nr:serine/threonine protein kinase [Paracoccaceae bacterium]